MDAQAANRWQARPSRRRWPDASGGASLTPWGLDSPISGNMGSMLEPDAARTQSQSDRPSHPAKITQSCLSAFSIESLQSELPFHGREETRPVSCGRIVHPVE